MGFAHQAEGHLLGTTTNSFAFIRTRRARMVQQNDGILRRFCVRVGRSCAGFCRDPANSIHLSRVAANFPGVDIHGRAACLDGGSRKVDQVDDLGQCARIPRPMSRALDSCFRQAGQMCWWTSAVECWDRCAIHPAEDLHAVWISHLHRRPLRRHAASLLPPLRFRENGMRKIPGAWAGRLGHPRVEDFVRSSVNHHMANTSRFVELKGRGRVSRESATVRHARPERSSTRFQRSPDGPVRATGGWRIRASSGPLRKLVTLAKGAAGPRGGVLSPRDRDSVRAPLTRGCRPRRPPTPGRNAAGADSPGPGTREEEAVERAGATFNGAIEVSRPGVSVEA